MRRNSLVLGLTAAAVAVLVGALWYWSDQLWRIAQGPEPVTLAQLSQGGVEASGRWLEVTSDVRPGHLLKTTSRRRRGGESITNHFALIKDKAVIVETSLSALPATFLAWSSVFDEESDYYKRARRQLDAWSGAPSRIPLSPLLLRTSSGVAFTQWGTVSAIGAAAIVLIVLFLRTLWVLQDFTRTGPIARLRKSVRAPSGVRALVAEIDGQLATLDPRARRTGPLLLPSWLVSVTQSSFSLLSASDVVWVTPYKVTRRLYSVIPISRSHQVHVVSRTRQSVALQVPQDRVGDVLRTLHHWAPWAVVGPDPTMEARFGKATAWSGMRRLFSRKPSRAQLIA